MLKIREIRKPQIKDRANPLSRGEMVGLKRSFKANRGVCDDTANCKKVNQQQKSKNKKICRVNSRFWIDSTFITHPSINPEASLRINHSPLKRGFFLFLFMFIFTLPAFAQDTELDKYLEIAAQNNPELQSLFYEYRSVLEQAPQVSALPDPEVMFMYFVNPETYSNPFRRMTASVTQTFPWFGSLSTAEKRVQNLAKARSDLLINARNEVFKDVKEVWFRMYETRHHIRIFQENLELLEMLESTSLSLYETGQSSQIDVIRIQIEIDKIQTRIKQMQDKLEPLQTEFNTLLNQEPKEEISIPMPMERHLLTIAPDEILQRIQAQSPRLSQLDHQRQAAKHALDEAHLDGLPSFGIGVEVMAPNYMYMPLMPGDRFGVVASISVKVPLYRNRYNAQKREARLNIRSIEAQKTGVVNRLSSDAEKQLQEYRDAQYRITLYEDNLMPKTRQALDISMEAYTTEAGSFEELIQLQQQILDYEMLLNTAYVERNIAIAELEYLYGMYNVTSDEIEFNNQH
ncbi:MAG: TolC family protein [Balneolales bacterium]